MQNNQKGSAAENLVHSVTSKSLCINLSIIDSYEFGLSLSLSDMHGSVCLCICMSMCVCV